MKRIAWALLALMFTILMPAFAQKVTVKVINRQNSDRTYGYLVANRKAALGQTFDLQGATLTLQLADGRVAVVNCKGMDKSSVAFRRDCRVPLIDSLDVDFHGDHAKLFWSVSLDGKKIQSETYKVIAVLASDEKQSPLAP